MVTGVGGREMVLGQAEVRGVLGRAFDSARVDGQRVLAIFPDGTRTAPTAQLFEALYGLLTERGATLDVLIALGTHQPMDEEAITHLLGATEAERAARFPGVNVFNHEWDRPEQLFTAGVISPDEAAELTGGLLTDATAVTLNRRILDYDRLLICGPVFPHEVAGFSGGAKYLFPGIAGPAIINFTHWLGALATSMRTIGVMDTPVRRVITRAARLVPRPIECVALVMDGQTLRGIYAGPHEEAFRAAATLSAQLNIHYVDLAFRQVLSMPATRYDDLWTAAKAMYKTEPVVTDGGEVIIYAPHITEVSYTHGPLIDAVGYHVRDYFLKQWARFADVPGAILAHSTHVKGAGEYELETGVEAPRIQVTLATGIPEERCRRINLGYRDYREIAPEEWANREDEGILLVRHAGEVLYRLREEQP